MGVKSFFDELKSKIPHHRLFKGLITDFHNVMPDCMPHAIKTVEILEGDAIVPGCFLKITFADGSYTKYKIDAIDVENHICKYTLIEGDILGDKVEKICYDTKFEATPDGGCVIKFSADHHSKGDVDISDEVINAIKEHAIEIYKACEEHLTAHPHVCA